MNVEAGLFIMTGIYTIATILICFFTHRSTQAVREQVSEMKRQYDNENRAYIEVEVIYEQRAFYGLRLVNHGKRTATNVKVKIDHDFLDSIAIAEIEFRSHIQKLRSQTFIIGVGQSYKFYLGSNKLRDNTHLMPVSGTISYTDATAKDYNQPLYIDLKSYATFYSINNEMDDILEALKNIEKAIVARNSKEDEY